LSTTERRVWPLGRTQAFSSDCVRMLSKEEIRPRCQEEGVLPRRQKEKGFDPRVEPRHSSQPCENAWNSQQSNH